MTTDDRDSGADVADAVTVPVGPDGVPTEAAAALYQGAPPIPTFTPENCICVRGPCRHYLEVTSHFDAANSEDVFRQRNRYCLLPHGEPLDLVDDVVYDCNKWHPETYLPEAKCRQVDQETYRENHPEYFEPQSDDDEGFVDDETELEGETEETADAGEEE